MTSEHKVFVVDDDEAVRDSLQALLESDGYTVEVFESGAAFLKAYSQQQTGCLVVDVQMPEMNGLELQQRLIDSGFDLPIIVITGHGDIPMAVKALKSGAFDFIEKPFDDDDFLTSVRHAGEQSRQDQGQRSLAAQATGRIARLTARERDVLEQLVIGRPNKVIAYELNISPRTVELHRARVMEKMQARSLSQLVRMALSVGIAPDPD